MQFDGAMHPGDDLRSELQRSRRGVRWYAADRHRALRMAVDALVHHVDEPHRFAAGLRELSAAVREHLAAEEDLLIPQFQLADPEEGDALRTEHARIREALGQITAEDPHRAAKLRRLGELFDQTSAHEDRTMYAWAEDHLPA